MPLRKVTDTQYVSKFVILYREDLEEIESALLDVRKSYNPDVTYSYSKKAKHKNEYKANKLSEIPNNISVTHFRIFTYYLKTGHTSYISISENWRHRIYMSANNPDIYLRGKFEEVKDLVQSRENRVFHWIDNSYLILYPLLWITIILSGAVIISRHKHHTLFLIWLSSAYSLAILFAVRFLVTHQIRINVKNSNQAKPLILRKREELVIQIIAGVIALIIFAGISLIIKI